MAAPPLVYVLNGPNLNLLGMREPEIYGTDTLDDIAGRLEDKAKAVLLNAGALSHTSLALYDAIRSIRTPVIEVHLSNPAAREAYRHHSFVGMAAKGTVAGFGAFGYELALDAAARL